MKKFEEKYDQILSEMKATKGLLNSIGRYKEIKKVCDKCGMMIPKYSGRYPSNCPACNDPVDYNDKEVTTGDGEFDADKEEVKENRKEKIRKMFNLEEKEISVDDDQKKKINDIIAGKTGRDSDDWNGMQKDINKILGKKYPAADLKKLVDSL